MITHDEEQLNIRRLLYQKEERHLMEKLAKKKAKLKAAEGRIRARISARERKRRTRRLILIGSYMEHVTQTDPDRKDRLMKDSMASWNGIGTGNCSTFPQKTTSDAPSIGRAGRGPGGGLLREAAYDRDPDWKM